MRKVIRVPWARSSARRALIRGPSRRALCLRVVAFREVHAAGGAPETEEAAEPQGSQWWYRRGIDAHMVKVECLKDLDSIVRHECHDFDELNLTTALHIASTLPKEPSLTSLANKLLQQTLPLLPTFHAARVASIAEALYRLSHREMAARLSHTEMAAYRCVADVVIAKQYVGSLTGKQVAAIAQAFSGLEGFKGQTETASLPRQVITSLLDAANPTAQPTWRDAVPGGDPLSLVHQFDAEDACLMLEAMVDVQLYDPQFVSSLCQELTSGNKVEAAPFSVLSRLAISLTRLRHRDLNLMDLILGRIPALEEPPTQPEEIAGLVHAFVELDCWDGSGWILRSLGSEQWVLSVRRFRAQDIASLAWSHCVMREHQPWVLELAVRAQRVGINLSVPDRANIFSYIEMLERIGQLPSISRSADFKQLRACCEAAATQLLNNKRAMVPGPGSMHQGVAEACRALGLGEVEVNALVAGVTEPIDVLVTQPGDVRIAIVVATAQQLTQSLPNQLLGGPLAALKVLMEQGWGVAVVPVHEWVVLPADLESRQTYMKQVIHKASKQCALR